MSQQNENVVIQPEYLLSNMAFQLLMKNLALRLGLVQMSMEYLKMLKGQF